MPEIEGQMSLFGGTSGDGLVATAVAYVALVAAGDQAPARTLADLNGTPLRTVQDRVTRARAAGILTPAPGPGRAGGQLTGRGLWS